MITEEKKKELGKLAQDIATGLGSEWTGTYQRLYNWKDIAEVKRQDGATIHLYPVPKDSYKGIEGRIIIDGEYPDKYSSYSHRTKEITVSQSRAVEAIIAEIKRRFLPNYLESYIKAVESVKRSEDYENARLEAIKNLANIVKTELHNGEIYLHTDWHSEDNPPNDDWRPSAIYTTVKCSSKWYGDIKIDSVPVSLLAKLLKVIADYTEAKP